MNLKLTKCRCSCVRGRGFTVTEVAIAVAVFSVVVLSLVFGITFGFRSLGITREELRATQLMLEKMETIRLYTWDQLNDPAFVPGTFSEYYIPSRNGDTNGTGVQFFGTVTITNATGGYNYTTNLRKVVVDLVWTSNGIRHERSMSSQVARDGLQDYIY